MSKLKPVKKAAVKPGKKNKPAIPHDPESKTSKLVEKRTEANLSPAMKLRRDRFIAEYLMDFNATAAFIRLRNWEAERAAETTGVFEPVDHTHAGQQGYMMTREPYVAAKIQEAMQQAEEQNIVTRKDVLFGLKREANFHGLGAAHGARVSAWSGLGRILGMETQKIEQNLALRGGIMIVPATEDGMTWEQRAAATQAALKEEVRK